METFKTVNNWICKRFIRHLFNGNYRACLNMYFNFFDRLDLPVKKKMLNYFFTELVDVYGKFILDDEHVLKLDFIEHSLLLSNVFIHMREESMNLNGWNNAPGK